MLRYPLPEDTPNPVAIALPWLVILRWGAIFCQAPLIILAIFLANIKVPVIPLGFLLGSMFVSNVFLRHRFRGGEIIPEQLVTLVLFCDVLFLTGLLMVTGGSSNPFSFLYLLHVVIASLLLPSRWCLGFILSTILCFGLLFLPGMDISANFQVPLASVPAVGYPLPIPNREWGLQQFRLQEMLPAFAVTALFIGFFVNRIQNSFSRHHKLVSNLHEERLRSEKLASLTALAGGAAHELATPLATIAVAASEMVYVLEEREGEQELLEDGLLIRDQVARCKEILYQMSANGGEHMGEELSRFSLSEFLQELQQSFNTDPSSCVQLDLCHGDDEICIGRRTLGRCLRALLQNGIDASLPGQQVNLRSSRSKKDLIFEVTDSGCGMAPEDMERATEPFFSTKESAMGLGLFLVKAVADRFEGALEIESVPDQGSTVTFRLAAHLI